MERSDIRRFGDEGILAICPSAETAASKEALMEPDGTRERLDRAGERIARLVDLGMHVEAPMPGTADRR